MKHSREERERRQRLHEEMNKAPPPLVETDEDIIRKLLSKQPYVAEDMIKCAEQLLTEYSHDFSKQFILIENTEQLDGIFEQLDMTLMRPYFFIFSKREYYHIIFCLLKDRKTNFKILYKDPFSNMIDGNLELKFRLKFDSVEFIIHMQEQKAISEENEIMCGPISLRNMKILLECLQVNSKNVVENFKHLEFCTPTEVNRDRFGRVMYLTCQISKNQGFLVKLREFINTLPTDLISSLQESEKYDEYESSIQEEYPIEMENVHILLQIISDTISGLEILKILKNICDILGLNYSKIQSLFPASQIENEITQCEGDATSTGTVSSDETLNSSIKQPGSENSDKINQKLPENKDEITPNIVNKKNDNAEGDNSNNISQMVSIEEKELIPELQSSK